MTFLKHYLQILIPLLVGTWFLAEGVINIIADSRYQAAGPVLRIIMIALAFIFFGNLFNNVASLAIGPRH
ncbi:MAG: hypothetical protein EBW14_19965 [Oxalobacteraceae bacterium]|nr:hypothetical protein [Oxalobacteraceae bacterium]